MTWKPSGRRYVPGWKRNARPKCGSPCATKTTSAGVGASSASSPRRSASGSRAWARRAGRCRSGRASMAAAGSPASRPRCCARKCKRLAAACRCKASASGCLARPCSSLARRRRSASICPRSPAARSAGARGTRSPTRGRTWPRCKRARTSAAITLSSMARRSGPHTPTRRTGSFAWCVPTFRRRSTPASASCCSTWKRRA